MATKSLSLLIIIMITVLAVGCRLGGDEPLPPATLWIHCLDLSGSPREHDRQRWARACEGQLGRLKAGDAVIIFGLHENSATAAPLFEGRSRYVPAEAGASEQLKARLEFEAMVSGARAALQRAFSVVPAGRTHILEVLHRIQPDAQRPEMRLVFYSDMIENSTWINLGSFNIEGREVETARSVAGRAGIAGLRLGARVECILDDVTTGQRPHTVNSRRSLALYWRETFAQAGAELAWFEARIPE